MGLHFRENRGELSKDSESRDVARANIFFFFAMSNGAMIAVTVINAFIKKMDIDLGKSMGEIPFAQSWDVAVTCSPVEKTVSCSQFKGE